METPSNDTTRQGRCSPIAVRALVAVTLVLGVVLRVWLALMNADANDPHLPVIRIIAFEHRFPAKAEAWEAFQPKLYHTTVALLWRALPTRDPLVLVHAAQLLSCVAGILTLMVLLRFLRARGGWVGPLAFALVALSPALVGISAQATNDAFVILFGSLALGFGTRFFDRWRSGDFAGIVVASVLAGLSKGNGLVVILAVLVTFGAAFLFPTLGTASQRRRTALGYGALFVALVVPTVALVGPYATFYREFGTPFVTNWEPSPLPHFYRETVSERPGLTSVVHGLLTFRFIDLLRHPASNYDRTVYPRHRTSLWTRVYAQTHSSRFEGWPSSWASESRKVRNLTRLLFVLGLVPTAILGVGLAVALSRTIREGWVTLQGASRSAPRSPQWAPTVLLVAAVLGHLAFVAVYAIWLRDYSSMKQIFVLPALLGFAVLFADGAEWLDGGRRGATLLRGIAGLALAALLAGYTVDAVVLIRDLRTVARTAPPPELCLTTGTRSLNLLHEP